MEHRTLTFVYGATHYDATLYIRKHVKEGSLLNHDCRNITNVDSLRGLRSTDSTTIRFVWLKGCIRNKTHTEFKYQMAMRQAAGANIQEVMDNNR